MAEINATANHGHTEDGMSETPETDALMTKLGMTDARAGDSGEMRDLARSLERQRDILLEAVKTAANIYALQARRDCADPDMLKGWRDLQEKAQAALSKSGAA